MRKIFIGSSSGAKKKANVVRRILQDLGVESVICWFDPDVFIPGDSTLDNLLKLTHECHAAVFIFDKDDELADTSGARRYVTRDNVILEAGLFISALGKDAVVLCHVPGAHMLSDYSGVTHLLYDADDPDRMKETFKGWLLRRVRGDRVPKSENNIFMKSRRIIHTRYSPQDALHWGGEAFCHIHKIRIMNMAGNLVISPEYADPAHEPSEVRLSQVIRSVLEKTNAILEFMLLEPNEANLRDAATRMPNPNAKTPEELIFASWKAIGEKIESDSVYKMAYQTKRFRCFAVKIGMPYAIFGVEYDTEYARYNHVKIDLYSSGLGNESQRRSFIVWQDMDPENYDFFIHNFDNIRGNRSVCYQAEPGQAGSCRGEGTAAACEKMIENLLRANHLPDICSRMNGFAEECAGMLRNAVKSPSGILNAAERVIALELIEPDSDRLSVTITKYFDYIHVDQAYPFSVAFWATEMQAKTYHQISLKIDGEDYTPCLHLEVTEDKARGQLPYHVKSNRIPLPNPQCQVEYTAAYECLAREFFQSTRLNCLCGQFKAEIFLGVSLKKKYELLCATFSPFSKIHHDDCKAGELSKPYVERIILPRWSLPGSGYVITLKKRSGDSVCVF